MGFSCLDEVYLRGSKDLSNCRGLQNQTPQRQKFPFEPDTSDSILFTIRNNRRNSFEVYNVVHTHDYSLIRLKTVECYILLAFVSLGFYADFNITLVTFRWLVIDN